MESVMEPGGDSRDEIARLWNEIEVWTGRDRDVAVSEDVESAPESMAAGSEPPRPREAHGPVFSSRPVSRAAASAPPVACEGAEASELACTDVCTLAAAICGNAETICRIAGDLDDAWSRDRCRSAGDACNDATERCCACRSGQP